jgi:hypothetical protein
MSTSDGKLAVISDKLLAVLFKEQAPAHIADYADSDNNEDQLLSGAGHADISTLRIEHRGVCQRFLPCCCLCCIPFLTLVVKEGDSSSPWPGGHVVTQPCFICMIACTQLCFAQSLRHHLSCEPSCPPVVHMAWSPMPALTHPHTTTHTNTHAHARKSAVLTRSLGCACVQAC